MTYTREGIERWTNKIIELRLNDINTDTEIKPIEEGHSKD